MKDTKEFTRGFNAGLYAAEDSMKHGEQFVTSMFQSSREKEIAKKIYKEIIKAWEEARIIIDKL